MAKKTKAKKAGEKKPDPLIKRCAEIRRIADGMRSIALSLVKWESATVETLLEREVWNKNLKKDLLDELNHIRKSAGEVGDNVRQLKDSGECPRSCANTITEILTVLQIIMNKVNDVREEIKLFDVEKDITTWTASKFSKEKKDAKRLCKRTAEVYKWVGEHERDLSRLSALLVIKAGEELTSHNTPGTNGEGTAAVAGDWSLSWSSKDLIAKLHLKNSRNLKAWLACYQNRKIKRGFYEIRLDTLPPNIRPLLDNVPLGNTRKKLED